MNYQDAVTEAHRLDQIIEEAETTAEEAKWARAELAWSQIQAGISQRQWARDTGKARSVIQDWIKMWDRWGGRLAGRPAFQEAWNTVMGRDEAVEEHGSQYQAKARTAVRNLPPEEKAAVVREALEDDDVATRVMRDPATRGGISRARERVWSEQEQGVSARQQASPGQHEAARTAEHFEVGNHLRLSRFHAAEATRRLQDIADPDEAMLRAFAGDEQEVRDALDWFRTVREGGRVDDAALARLLEGGAS
jgi:hypothetical protein